MLECDLSLGQTGKSLRSIGTQPGGFTDQLHRSHMRNVQDSGCFRCRKAHGQGWFFPVLRHRRCPGRREPPNGRQHVPAEPGPRRPASPDAAEQTRFRHSPRTRRHGTTNCQQIPREALPPGCHRPSAGSAQNTAPVGTTNLGCEPDEVSGPGLAEGPEPGRGPVRAPDEVPGAGRAVGPEPDDGDDEDADLASGSTPGAPLRSRSVDRENAVSEERFIPQLFQLPLTFRGQNRLFSGPLITGDLPAFPTGWGSSYGA